MRHHREQPQPTAPNDAPSELLRQLYPELRAFARTVCPPEDDPEDLVHDALTQTLRARSLSDLDHPRAYLKRAIANTAANRRRRWGRWRQASARLIDDDVCLPQYPSDLSFLTELAPTDRQVVYQADVEGRPSRDIARTLGLTENGVNLRRSRSRAVLRRHLAATALALSALVWLTAGCQGPPGPEVPPPQVLTLSSEAVGV
jgi:DNA-directed RNA polymerase specialized sigma24 family protein